MPSRLLLVPTWLVVDQCPKYGKVWVNRPPYLENEIGNPILRGISRARYPFSQFHSVPLVGISKAQL